MLRGDESPVGFFANGGCYVCRNGQIAVDTEVNIEGEGVLGLCRGCVHDAALLAGFVVNEDQTPKIEALEQQIAKLALEYGKVKRGLEVAVRAAADAQEYDPTPLESRAEPAEEYTGGSP